MSFIREINPGRFNKRVEVWGYAVSEKANHRKGCSDER